MRIFQDFSRITRTFSRFGVKNLRITTPKFNPRCHLSMSSSVIDQDSPESSSLLQNILQYHQPSESQQVRGGRKVIVIMPRQKFGDGHRTKERGQFLLDETGTLVQTVTGWNVVGTEMISTSSVNSKQIFGATNLKNLREYVRESRADAVVFALDNIRPAQHQFFQEYFRTEIYDRFSVVLKIFAERASTKEAKLQLSLAELAYVRRNLHHLSECDFSKFSVAENFGGKFDTFFQVKKQLISDVEGRIKKKLVKIERDNHTQKQLRGRLEIPTVAVVGYTNSGKTSLIKALTRDQRLNPEDRLFATLSTSVHKANLTSNMKALFIDTIGFITEMPTTLIHCFKSTLSEISTADLIVHVTDVSHPDYELQIETVHQTLREIDVPEKLLQTMIQVENKIDKLEEDEMERFCAENRDNPIISTTERIGLNELSRDIEQRLIQNTDRIQFKIRVPNGGEEYQWLHHQATIVDSVPDTKNSESNLMIMNVIMTKSKLGKFKKAFQNE